MKVLIAILALLTALAIAGIAAWFSIIGLIAIFAAAPIPIIIMGSALEVGKLVTSAWLKNNWNSCRFLLKTYLTVAVIVLMLITSIGIFGFLSKAHIEQGAPVSHNIAKIERFNQKIKIETQKLENAQKVISNLDEALTKFIEEGFVTRGLDARKLQEAERSELNLIVSNSEKEIDRLTDEKFELESTVRDYEVEVGPLKFIAEVLYEDPTQHLESAVRALIILLMFAFDPLAVLLLLAANQSFQEIAANKQPKPNKTKQADKYIKEPVNTEANEEILVNLDDPLLRSTEPEEVIGEEPNSIQPVEQVKVTKPWAIKVKKI